MVIAGIVLLVLSIMGFRHAKKAAAAVEGETQPAKDYAPTSA